MKITLLYSLLLITLTGCGPETSETEFGVSLDTREAPTQSMVLTSIVDGDTLDFSGLRCRINGIDTPETFMTQTLLDSSQYCDLDVETIQAMGAAAKEAAEQFLSIGSEYFIRIVDTDVYGRSVCQVELSGGKTFGEEMITAGYAVVLEQYLDEEIADFYIKDEVGASHSDAGLWYFYPDFMQCLSD